MLRLWDRTLQLPFLAACGLTYLLGTGVADYLGHPPVIWQAMLGILMVWLILSGSQVSFEYFNHVSAGALPFSMRKEKPESDAPSPLTLLVIFFILMAIAVAFGFSLMQNTSNGGLIVLLLAGLLLLSVLFIGQPRLVYSGYGELVKGLICCCLVPALAFSIQSGQIHQLLLPVTFPLVFIFLAINLALELDTFAADLKLERRSLLLRLTWQRGIILHHVLLLVGFILLAVAPLFGVAWRLIWPSLLAMVIAILEVWLVNRIALGLPPRWALLKFTAWLAFMLPVYLLAITFWMA
jgi:1,4-dihydroxy-2-naphthoate octaprenyltransferase